MNTMFLWYKLKTPSTVKNDIFSVSDDIFYKIWEAYVNLCLDD